MSPDSVIVKWKNLIVGEINNRGDLLSYKPLDSLQFGKKPYPVGIYPLEKLMTKEFKEYTPTHEDIYRWLEGRVFPENREGAMELLRSLDLYRYDLWEVVVKTKGITFNDNYWITEGVHDRFEDYHPLLIYITKRKGAEGPSAAAAQVTTTTEINFKTTRSPRVSNRYKESNVFRKFMTKALAEAVATSEEPKSSRKMDED